MGPFAEGGDGCPGSQRSASGTERERGGGERESGGRNDPRHRKRTSFALTHVGKGRGEENEPRMNRRFNGIAAAATAARAEGRGRRAEGGGEAVAMTVTPLFLLFCASPLRPAAVAPAPARVSLALPYYRRCFISCSLRSSLQRPLAHLQRAFPLPTARTTKPTPRQTLASLENAGASLNAMLDTQRALTEVRRPPPARPLTLPPGGATPPPPTHGAACPFRRPGDAANRSSVRG